MLQQLMFDDWRSDDMDIPEYWRFDYMLVDDKFGTVSGNSQAPVRDVGRNDLGLDELIDDSLPSNCRPHLLMIGAIIKEYSTRNLSIEGELITYLLACGKEHKCTLQTLLDNYNHVADKPHNQEFAQLWKLVNQTRIKQLVIFE